ncbi:uncharacterized protein LOC135850039 isoform X1 [Planococcus citri]|uniref:uncharacterized protein LOC135850039 isoform X1 n=1 Tax=Planococcus citri TaxID=170843 RepID=UPI0031F81C1E
MPTNMDEQCRLCTLHVKPLINIFSETGISHKLAEKITQRLQIFVTRDDILSKSVCCNCCGKLEIFDQFVREVHTSQAVLHKEKIDTLTQPKVLKKEGNRVIDTIEIDDDVQPVTSSCHDNILTVSRKPSIESKDDISEDDRHVSVIKYPTVCSNNNNDRTRPLNISPARRTEIVYKDENTKYLEINGDSMLSSESTSEVMDEDNFPNKNGVDAEHSSVTKKYAERKNRVSENALKKLQSDLSDKMFSAKRTRRISLESSEARVLRSSFRRSTSDNDRVTRNSNDYCNVEKQQELKVRDTRRRSSNSQIPPNSNQRSDRKDFSAQIGNTLLADLRSLKNSLLLRKVKTKNASVLTIPVPVLPRSNSSLSSFADTNTSKGCQTEIILGAKSEDRNVIVYQKISFDGRSFTEIGSESNAVITSPLPS